MTAYDLHIHSCLSPCADDDMTPYNIVAMAALKGLDLISITDHNSALHQRVAAAHCADMGLLYVPGMEITTREDVHLLAYFPTVEQAEAMGDYCMAHMGALKNKPHFFGEQRVMNERDEQVDTVERLLIQAVWQDIGAIHRQIRHLGGVAVPAHIYRGHGMLHTLGFLPQKEGFTTVEVKEGEPVPPGLRALISSDAHRLGDISEPVNSLPVADRSGFISYICGTKIAL